MTQFGSNVLLLTRFVVTIPGQRKKQDGGAHQGVFLANYSQYVS